MAKKIQWEYKRVNTFEELAAAGLDGWELVGISPATFRGQPMFYLKRQLE